MLFGTFAIVLCILIFVCNWKAGIVATAILLPLNLLPIGGFKEPQEVKKVFIEKLRISPINNRVYYVRKKGNRYIYAWDNRGRYQLDGLAYEEAYVSGKVKIYESGDCKVPIMKVFKVKPNDNISFAPFSTKTEYVFYLPMGTVLEDECLEQNPENNIV